MDLLRDSWILYRHHVRATLRMPVFLIISIIQPILWVSLFGQLFGRVAALPGFEGGTYVQFLAPGIGVMTALFGGAYSGLGMLGDIERGVLDRLLATPVRRGAVVAARIALAASQVTVQAAIILAVASFLGARPRGGAAGLLAVFLAAALLASAFAAVSNALALATRRQELVIAAMNFMVLPMTFLSSMIMSRNLMPGWIRSVARFNPVNWAVVAARDGFEGQALTELLTHLALLATVTLLCATLATRVFRSYQRSL